MTTRLAILAGLAVMTLLLLFAHLSIGRSVIPLHETVATLMRFEAESFEQSIILYQRLPRALIAAYVGGVMACSGLVLQTLCRNPLASPSTLGVSAGATLYVVVGAFVFNLGLASQGFAALIGAVSGFIACLFVARLASRPNDSRGLALILSGALTSMLLMGLTNALLLSDPARRSEFLSWITGNINHVYFDRLAAFWWIGAAALTVLMLLARSLTLLSLGAEKAASAGVNTTFVTRLAFAATVLASGSAVAICGPIGFVGLVVPHIMRPLMGNDFTLSLPACTLAGAGLCILADLAAREAFQPYTVHTGLILDLLGGFVFAVIVKRYYLGTVGGRLA